MSIYLSALVAAVRRDFPSVKGVEVSWDGFGVKSAEVRRVAEEMLGDLSLSFRGVDRVKLDLLFS